MRTNIDIDDQLIDEAKAATGLTTKREVVEAGLRTLIALNRQSQGLGRLRGIGWEGDLDAMRLDRSLEQP